MTSKTTFWLAATLAGGLALPAAAQESQEDQAGLDEAADRMVVEYYAIAPVEHRTPSETIARLQELGYTNIQEFDVEWGHYEVEAMTPAGDEVEIEIDPVTGAILDIDENWF